MVNKSVLNNIFRVINFKFFNVKKLILLIIFLILAYHLLTLIRFAKTTTDSLSFFEETKSLDDQNNQDNQNIDSKNDQSNSKETNLKETQSSKRLLGVNGCKLIDDEYKQYTAKIDGVTYPQYLYLSQNKSINYDCLNNSTPLKKILAWNKFYGESYMGYGSGPVKPFADKNCPITNCEVIQDKNKLNEAEHVIILMTDAIDVMPSRESRPKSQRWIYANIESPFYHPQSWSGWNGFFNYTADYLTESEFGINYESQKRFLWARNKTFNETHDYHAGKTGFVSALISNCNAQNERLNYLSELRRYVPVEIHGTCGTACPANVDCREWVGRKYKFYFAFENSNCKDYITEKFFMMLKYDIIPIVIGGGNYSRFVPKSAYINAMEYPSAMHLAQYLKYLDGNVTAFNSYFKWKKHVVFLDYTVSYAFICEMCIQLHLDHHFGMKEKVINDFDAYWNRKKQCFNTKVTQKDDVKYFKFDDPI